MIMDYSEIFGFGIFIAGGFLLWYFMSSGDEGSKASAGESDIPKIEHAPKGKPISMGGTAEPASLAGPAREFRREAEQERKQEKPVETTTGKAEVEGKRARKEAEEGGKDIRDLGKKAKDPRTPAKEVGKEVERLKKNADEEVGSLDHLKEMIAYLERLIAEMTKGKMEHSVERIVKEQEKALEIELERRKQWITRAHKTHMWGRLRKFLKIIKEEVGVEYKKLHQEKALATRLVAELQQAIKHADHYRALLERMSKMIRESPPATLEHPLFPEAKAKVEAFIHEATEDNHLVQQALSRFMQDIEQLRDVEQAVKLLQQYEKQYEEEFIQETAKLIEQIDINTLRTESH